MKHIALIVTWISVAVVIVAFFLPWANLNMREPGLVRQLREKTGISQPLSKLSEKLGKITASIRRGAETITGDLPTVLDIPKQVSGVQIPKLANQKNAKVTLALVEMLTNKRQHIGIKSYAVYLLPGLALTAGLLITFLSTNPRILLGTAAVCAVVAAIGFWKLSTTPTDMLFISITIGPGLWLSFWGYVGLAIAAACQILLSRRGKA